MLIDFRKLFPKYGIKPKGVLHVGANVGEEAPVYHELGIHHVAWVEANPDIFKILKERVSKYPNNVTYNFAAGDREAEVVLHESNNASQSSSIFELGTHKTAHPDVHYVRDINVKMNRIEDVIIDLQGFQHIFYDFLNIDIQGAELLALRGMGDFLRQFKWAYLEVNQQELYKGCALIQDIDTYLLGFGFKRVETKWCGNTGWGDALYVKKI